MLSIVLTYNKQSGRCLFFIFFSYFSVFHESVKSLCSSIGEEFGLLEIKEVSVFIITNIITQPISRKSEQICSRFVTTCCQQADIWMHRKARFRRRTLHVPNLIVLDATQERQ
jgi:hypothetical protein